MGTTYYVIAEDFSSKYSDFDRIKHIQTGLFYCEINEIYQCNSYSLYGAQIIGEDGNPTTFSLGQISIDSFRVTGSSRDYQLVVDFHLPDQTYTHTFHSDIRFGFVQDSRPRSYTEEWGGDPIISILATMREINIMGVEVFKELTRLRRSNCLIETAVNYEKEKLEEEKQWAHFFTDCLEDTLFADKNDSLQEAVDHFTNYGTTIASNYRTPTLLNLFNRIQKNEKNLLLIRANRIEMKSIIRYYKGHLISAKIKEGTAEIPFSQFEFSKSLKTLIIPQSVKTIGNDAFNYSSLDNIFFLSPKPPVLMPGFPSPGAPHFHATIFVPQGCKANYEANKYWRELLPQIQEQ